MLTARTSGYDEHLLARLHGACDNLITISTETFRDKFVNTLEIPKVRNAKKRQENRFSFQVESEGGIKIFPLERVKAQSDVRSGFDLQPASLVPDLSI